MNTPSMVRSVNESPFFLINWHFLTVSQLESKTLAVSLTFKKKKEHNIGQQWLNNVHVSIGAKSTVGVWSDISAD